MAQGIYGPAEGQPEKREFTCLEDYQAAVGGLIEAVDVPDLGITIYVNDEGLLRHLPFNSRASFLWWDAKYSNVHRVEQAVEEHYRTVCLTPDFLAAMRQSLSDALADQESSQRALKEQLEGQLARLDTQEANLLDLLMDEEIPKDKVRAKLREIGNTRDRLTAQLEGTEDTLTEAVEFINANLRLLEDPYELYLSASDEVRRRLNQAIFTRVFIDHDDVTDHTLEEPLGDLFTVQTAYHAVIVTKSCEEPPPSIEPFTRPAHYPSESKKGATLTGDSFTSATLGLVANPDHRVLVCNKPQLVGLAVSGFRTSFMGCLASSFTYEHVKPEPRYQLGDHRRRTDRH